MKQVYNPIQQAWQHAENLAHQNELRISRRNRAQRKTNQYLQTEHVFELTKSGNLTGETKKMTGRVANNANEKLFQDYLAQLDNNDEDRALFRWEKKGELSD